MDGASATTFSPTDLVLASGEGGNDTFNVDFASNLTTPITIAGSGSDTLNAYGSSDPTVTNYIVKNGNAQTITWGDSAGQASDSIGYSGIRAVDVTGGRDELHHRPRQPDYDQRWNRAELHHHHGHQRKRRDHQRRAEHKQLHRGSRQSRRAGRDPKQQHFGHEQPDRQRAAGNNTIAVAGDQVTAGTQTITNMAPLANLTVNGGSGNNQITVSTLTTPVQTLTAASATIPSP